MMLIVTERRMELGGLVWRLGNCKSSFSLPHWHCLTGTGTDSRTLDPWSISLRVGGLAGAPCLHNDNDLHKNKHRQR